MALVRALSKAAAVARRTNGMKYGKTIVDIFDDAMEEAMDALCAKRKEQERDHNELIPLHVGSPGDAKAMNFAKVARVNRAKKLAAGTGKKRAWGKLAVSVAMGGTPSTATAPVEVALTPRIQFDNLLEKEDLEKATPAAMPAVGIPAGENVSRLEKRVEEATAESKARDEAILERIASLEIALTNCVGSIANVVESRITTLENQQVAAKKRTPTMVRMRRSKLQRAETTPSIGMDSLDGSASLLTAAELERRELREAAGANGGLAPSLSHPFAHMGLDA